jgi:predicted enzyme related to lactoylglutathione lyase
MLSKMEYHGTVPALDIERAKRFYEEKLGLTPSEETPAGLVYKLQNSWFMLYPTQFAGTAQHTLGSFAVGDIEAEVTELKSRGLVFEEYDAPQLKTVNGIAMIGMNKAAWFKDSEGNILGLIQFG